MTLFGESRKRHTLPPLIRYVGRPQPTPAEAAASSSVSRPAETVRARQRAALFALHRAALPEAAGQPARMRQRAVARWGRALASWLELL